MHDCGFLGVHIFAAYVNRKASVSAQWEGPKVSLLRYKAIATTSALHKNILALTFQLAIVELKGH